MKIHPFIASFHSIRLSVFRIALLRSINSEFRRPFSDEMEEEQQEEVKEEKERGRETKRNVVLLAFGVS